MAANNPRHGDAIIEPRRDALGNTKLVATIQFQRYLDELATLALEDIESTDADQIIAATNAAFRAKLNALSTALLQLPNAIQDIQSNQGLVRRLQAQIREQQKQISDLEQLIHVR